MTLYLIASFVFFFVACWTWPWTTKEPYQESIVKGRRTIGPMNLYFPFISCADVLAADTVLTDIYMFPSMIYYLLSFFWNYHFSSWFMHILALLCCITNYNIRSIYIIHHTKWWIWATVASLCNMCCACSGCLLPTATLCSRLIDYFCYFAKKFMECAARITWLSPFNYTYTFYSALFVGFCERKICARIIEFLIIKI